MKISLLGYGKMGRIIDSLNTDHDIIHRFTIEDRDIEAKLSKQPPDVIIEFTQPKAVLDHIRMAFSLNIPIVTGTTGWHDQLESVSQACSDNEASLFYASNFSIGANLFFQISAFAARLINKQNTYQASIHESHHTTKEDAPSGTAITLAQHIISETDDLTEWHQGTEVHDQSLPIESIREGDIKGLHESRFISSEDTISIRHEANNRNGFALGAIRAAEWLQGRKGMYTMGDMLQSKS